MARGFPASVAGIVEIATRGPGIAGTSAAPRVLIEVPHGATGAAHYAAVRGRLRGPLPDDLDAFYFVNTDAGAPECAEHVARVLAAAGVGVVVLRCLVPRTFVDCNRIVDDAVDPSVRRGGFTPAIPAYVADAADRDLLRGLWRDYQAIVERAYDAVMPAGGFALQLHTFAPRSVAIDSFDDGIVTALRAAYAPERFESWPLRPEVELLTEATDGTRLAPRELVAALRSAYRSAGIEVGENLTYRLDPATTGHRHAARWPDRTLCVEFRRDLLATPYTPFRPMTIGAAETERLSTPLAATLLPRL